ncbi:MAG TPA: glycosyltransferase family 4 protein [Flavobacterium sp.]|jgi:glycosyltransferase involved in cell wall biosynthesis
MEEILIVSNYYPPEKGAAANRIEQLALKLKQNGYKVSVVCPLANYPEGRIFQGYRGRFSVTENIDGITVKRLWIYPSNSKNVLKRILSILSFAVCLKFYLLFSRTPKKVVVQSPPLMLSFISVMILSLKRKKIILNVSDLWPSAAIELGAMKYGSFSHKVFIFLEQCIYKNATIILGQSEEILTHVKTICSGKTGFLYRNFPEHKSVMPQYSKAANQSIKIFYAGLLGVAQGVLDACEHIHTSGLHVEFHIFGDGAERKPIEAYIAAHPKKNIRFHGMLKRDVLLERLKEFDVAFVPLKMRIYGSVPSKIFEYSALGIPVLYFGGGEGEQIVASNNLGWIAPVGNFAALNSELTKIAAVDREQLLQMKRRILQHASDNFNLEKQMQMLIGEGVF